jgi:hypothetical protein
MLAFLTGGAASFFERAARPASRTGVAAALHGRTPAEISAGITPVSYDHPPLDIRRYGGDNTGSADNHPAFEALFQVLLYAGGGSAVLPAGKYNLTRTIAVTLTANSIPNSTSGGLNLYAYGVVLNFTGEGYALDLFSPNTSASFYEPGLSIFGLNIMGSPRAAGGIRASDLSSARYVDVFVRGFTASVSSLDNGLGGTGFTLRNTVSWSENTRFIGCGAVNCTTGLAFVNAGGSTSFARTYVEHFFGAGITNFWFDIGGACAVYDSRFTHVAGNFGALAYFAIGKPGSDADLSGTVIDGIDAECNGAVANQSILRLRNFPHTGSGARRPKVCNISPFAGYNRNGGIPTWAKEGGEAIAGPEPAQLQGFDIEGPVSSNHGQSIFAEPNFHVNGASREVATMNSTLVTCNLTGGSAPVSGRVKCARSGNHVSLSIYDRLVVQRSSSNTMTLTGLTSEFWPSEERAVVCLLEIGGDPTVAIATIDPTGLITFAAATPTHTFSKTGFKMGVGKGLGSGMTLSYPL